LYLGWPPSRKRRLMIPVVLAPELRPDSWTFPPHRNTDAMMSRQLWLPNAFAPSLLGAAVLLCRSAKSIHPKATRWTMGTYAISARSSCKASQSALYSETGDSSRSCMRDTALQSESECFVL
jgi:hypothetical protein